MGNRAPRVIVVRNDEFSRYQQEFWSLCDRLGVCDEFRDGYHSDDEARLGDLFSFLDSAEAVAARVAALELPGISRSSYLVDVLRLIRDLWTVH
jgi:hypothetical protein